MVLKRVEKGSASTWNPKGFHRQLPVKKQAKVIDRLNTHSSNDLIRFLNNHGYVTINCNNTTQIGNSCGYISACVANHIYQSQDDTWVSLIKNDHPSYHPDILDYNFD